MIKIIIDEIIKTPNITHPTTITKDNIWASFVLMEDKNNICLEISHKTQKEYGGLFNISQIIIGVENTLLCLQVENSKQIDDHGYGSDIAENNTPLDFMISTNDFKKLEPYVNKYQNTLIGR